MHSDEAVKLDLFYIENWSLGTDPQLLARTIPAVLRRDGAYWDPGALPLARHLPYRPVRTEG